MRTNNASGQNPIRPQNLSCPAGGTNKRNQKQNQAPHGQRGEIVAPPSRNTSSDNPKRYTVLHRGFDTLTLSIKQNIPIKLFDYLTKEKELAETERRDVLVTYNDTRFLLRPNGGSGYRFILSDGDASATWSIKKPNAKDPWGIRVNIGSFYLATSGLGAARTYIETVLERFGVRTLETDISIARVDFCVDILAPDFVMHHDNAVMHSRTNWRDHITDDDKKVNGNSGRITSVTIGSGRNRQAIIYDKRAELIANRKSYWWDLWCDTLHRENPSSNVLATLRSVGARKDADKSRVWRVEMRAGKDLLKDRWDIRTWSDMFARYGDLIRESSKMIRYTEPNADTNRARWPNHPLWDVAASEMNGDLFEMRESADPNPLKEIHKAEKLGQLTQSMVGTAISMAALEGCQFDELPKHWIHISELIGSKVQASPERYAKQLQDPKDRYVFVGDTKAN